MKTFVAVRNGVITERLFLADDATVATHKISEDGGPIFRPYVDSGPPAFDSETHELTKRDDIRKSKVVVIYDLKPRVERQSVASLKREIKSLTPFMLGLLLEYENRFRTLEDKPPFTASDFRQHLKSKYSLGDDA